MPSRRSLISLVVLVACATLAWIALPTQASTPPSGTLAVPATAGQTASDAWTGTIPPGSNPTSACVEGAPNNDEHDVTVTVPPGAYDTVSAQFTFSITWTPSSPAEDTSDEIISVFDPDGNLVGSSDTSGTTESVSADNLKPGKYTVAACGFANAFPQDYKGKVTVVTKATSAAASVPSAPAQGLAFSASVPVDPQRDEAEPIMEIDPTGNVYTCGPSSFRTGADYAQVSTDDGDQFHLIGEPPRGQQAPGGGGDCALATATAKNTQTPQQYTYAYSGLGPLTSFVSASSLDTGHTLDSRPVNGLTIPGVDRQWMTFLDDKTVLLSYNQQLPRNIVVQKSTDGGLTYGPAVTASGPNPNFPGPMRSMPASLVPGATATSTTGRVPFYAWTLGARGSGPTAQPARVNFAYSPDDGMTWKNCVAAALPTDVNPQAFAVADADNAGNIYIAYSEETDFHTYLTVLPHGQLTGPSGCNGSATTAPTIATNPGFSKPVQVDRDNVRTTVFPWMVAGGDPGKVAVSFYGTESDGSPNTGAFKASWDVYVNESLNALDATPAVANQAFSQVKATTHPFHYDSICLNGLGCSLSVPPGDRSLADFFAIDLNPRSHRLQLVYNQAAKKPDDAEGRLATPLVVSQISGPTLDGQALSPPRPALRSASDDPTGDAQSKYSATQPDTPNPKNQPAADFTSASISPETDPATGRQIPDGGFNVTLRLASLKDGDLQQALSDTRSASLLWLFRFTNGFQASAASARYTPAGGFTFGFNDYTTGSAQCGSSDDKCLQYPGNVLIKGKVDQAAGTIVLSVPRNLLRALQGPTGPGQRPQEGRATFGTRFYDATAFSLANTSPSQQAQSFLTTLDNAPAMDFLLPAGPSAGANGPPPIIPPPGGAGTGPIATGTGPIATTACADRIRPRSRIDRRHSRGSRRGVVIRGIASDQGCRGSAAAHTTDRRGRVTAVVVAIGREVGRDRCRFLDRRGRFGRTRSCRRPTYVRARGTTRWSLTIRHRLPRGRYRARVKARDGARLSEARLRRENFLRFRIR